MSQLKLICSRCRGSGWLCDEHPDQPWDHADCDGAGIACRCNELAAQPRTDVFIEFDRLNEAQS